MHEARRRKRNLVEIAVFRAGVHVNDPVLLPVGETAQEQIVDQAEDGGVKADADRQREQSKQRESWRLEQLTKHKANVCCHMTRCPYCDSSQRKLGADPMPRPPFSGRTNQRVAPRMVRNWDEASV